MSQLILKILEALREDIHVLPKDHIREAANEKPENLDVLFDIGIECAQGMYAITFPFELSMKYKEFEAKNTRNSVLIAP